MKTQILSTLFVLGIVAILSQTAQAQLIRVTTCGQTLSSAGEYVLMNDLNSMAAMETSGEIIPLGLIRPQMFRTAVPGLAVFANRYAVYRGSIWYLAEQFHLWRKGLAELK